ncbi:hypothetical protein BZARG_779 [Bizionia argentinensis JUB59]|uniref:Phage major capsid protein n=1 Tax=Bizionia argentinensis JUB59 TaxID=1046627 RepID=G2EB96_9FLAO|nr:hypothetical protein [Bizionia argentinensis]EGV44365.1 hypothetical protein BZARG_779 [Bizionia argentinensis JUB59]
MPANFPEIWLGRIIQNLDTSDIAPFLNGIAEIAADVVQINQGQLSEKNKIYVPSTEFEVDVLINNTTYPLAVQTYADGTIEITLDKYQTKVVTLSDDQIIGASYDKIDVVTKSLIRSILVSKFKKALHSIAPQTNTATTPVMAATGGTAALADPDGRLRLVYEDLVAFKGLCDTAGFTEEDRRLVLCNEHWNDLLLDRKNFGNQLVDYAAGKPAPMIAGFELQKYTTAPIYTAAGVKQPFGTIAAPTDTSASIAFCVNGIAKKTGLTKQYFVKAENNPANQTNDLAYRHYFIVTPYQNRKIGAIR